MDQISKERPHWTPLSKERYLNSVGPDGAMFVGSPENVANKMIKVIEELGLDRFMLHLPIGSMPHEEVLKSIKLYGEKVVPIVREYFEKKEK